MRHLPEVDVEGHVVDMFFLDEPERSRRCRTRRC